MYLAGTRSFFLSLSPSSSLLCSCVLPSPFSHRSSFFQQMLECIYIHTLYCIEQREREEKNKETRRAPVGPGRWPFKAPEDCSSVLDSGRRKRRGDSLFSLSLSLSSSLSLHLSLSLPYVRRCFGGPPSIPPSFLLPTAAVQKTRIRHIEGERGRWIPGKCATVHSRRPQR